MKKVQNLNQMAEFIYEVVNTSKTELLHSVMTELIKSTPKDTGTLVNNWYVKLAPDASKITYHKTNSFSRPPVPRLTVFKWNKAYIFNNSEYLKKVNDGKSSPNDPGLHLNFVESAIKRGIANHKGLARGG